MYHTHPQHQYIFIHNAILELINVGETEIPIHNLRRRVKELQAQNPESELSPIEEEYIVSEAVLDSFQSAHLAPVGSILQVTGTWARIWE